MKYDYLVVGAGLYGAVFARQATDAGKKVLVIDADPQANASSGLNIDITNIHESIYECLVNAMPIQDAIKKTEEFVEFKRNSTVVILYIVAAVFYVVVAGGISLFRHMSYQSGIEDVGNTMHMFYSLRDGIINLDWAGIKENASYFFENFSPMYYVFLPMYILLPWFGTLLVLQVIMIVSGLIPLILLCNKFNVSKSGKVMFALNLAEDGRILSATYPEYAPAAAVFVETLPEGNIIAIVVPGPCRILGLFGRRDDYVIPWNCIRRIGPDIVLVDIKPCDCRVPRGKGGFLG